MNIQRIAQLAAVPAVILAAIAATNAYLAPSPRASDPAPAAPSPHVSVAPAATQERPLADYVVHFDAQDAAPTVEQPAAEATKPAPDRAEVFAIYQGGRADFGLLHESSGACAKKGAAWANARVVAYDSYADGRPMPVFVGACWRKVPAAESARVHVNRPVIQVCTLPHKIIFTQCSYILADDFVKPDSLPPAPEPAFPR